MNELEQMTRCLVPATRLQVDPTDPSLLTCGIILTLRSRFFIHKELVILKHILSSEEEENVAE